MAIMMLMVDFEDYRNIQNLQPLKVIAQPHCSGGSGRWNDCDCIG